MRQPLILLITLFTMTVGVTCLHSSVLSFQSGLAWAQADPEEGLEDLEDTESAPSASPKTPKSALKSNRSTTKRQANKSSKTARLKVTEVGDTSSNVKRSSSAEVYLKQIQRIESQVNELKEEIFRSRTRLAILKESVLASGLSGTELRIVHRNLMGANFKLERILYILDGSPIRQAVDREGDLDQQEEIEILNGPIAPGNHTLQVELVYRGNGFGVFSYLQSYRFTLNDVSTFRAEEGKRVTMSAIGYERSGVTLELKDRPDIRFERSVIDLDEEAEKEAKRNTSPSKVKRTQP